MLHLATTLTNCFFVSSKEEVDEEAAMGEIFAEETVRALGASLVELTRKLSIMSY